MMPFDDPGRRAAMVLSCTRHSGVMCRPGLLVLGSRRGGIPLAGAVRGWYVNGVDNVLCVRAGGGEER
jgi:hypothetical protein